MKKLNIDADYVAQLAELLQKTGLNEIELSEGETKIRLARQAPQIIEAQLSAPAARQTVIPGQLPVSEEPAQSSDANHPGAVKSPMVGTVYLAPEPGAPNFVEMGAEIKEGQTILIIEAMKVMNAIRAPHSGRVSKILAQNATPVEYGETLLIIE